MTCYALGGQRSVFKEFNQQLRLSLQRYNMATLGRLITKLPKNASYLTARPMGTNPSHAYDNTSGAAPASMGGLNFTLTETQHEVRI